MSAVTSMLSGVNERLQQLLVMVKKDTRLAIRSWKVSSIQILAPFVCLLLLLILQVIPHPAIYENGVQPGTSVTTIPPCKTYDSSICYSLMYAPSNPTTDAIIQKMADASNLQIVPFTNNTATMPSGSIVACENITQIIDFMWDNQNVTQAAVDFAVEYSNVDLSKSGDEYFDPNYVFSYNVLYNGTCLTPYVPLGTICPNIRYVLQRSIDEAFISYTTGTDVNIVLERRPFPTVSFNTALNDTVSTYGILFFYCGMMATFVITIYQIVFEKERKLKQGMKLMGLKSSVYWTSWFIHGTAMTLFETIIMMIGGYACMFAFFWKTNFFVNFLIFFLYGEAMLMLAFLISTLLNTSKSAITAGMLLFITGTLLQMLLSSPSLLAFVYYDHYWVSTMIYYMLVWYPPLNFAKLIEDVTSKSYDYGTYVGPGFSWGDLFVSYGSSDGVTLPPPVQSLYLLMVNMVLFAILTWYLENILPGERGAPSAPWFFLTKEYWGIPRTTEPTQVYGPLVREYENSTSIDEDVVREDEQVQHDTASSSAVRVVRLSKQYQKIPFIKTKWDVHAQDSLSFSIPEGNLFCLLGHNGAGKTTTINILTGLFPPTSGEAYIYGRSIHTEMNDIRRSMGVCPQHDILWNEMSAVEHLELFARLKNIPSHLRNSIIAEKLEMVKLTKVGNNRVGSYSGGMKRRLSVAISSIGEPNIIFLDEPTTGMDPVSRRHVWELIEELKHNRVIILTTHSMEEADVLADRIGIMAHGKLRCIGNSLHLKTKFGDGYRINIATKIETVTDVRNCVNQYLPNASLIAESGGSLVFGVNTDDYKTLVPFFRFLEDEEKKPNSIIRDWGISQTSLEDVFLKVTRQVYSGGDRTDGYNEAKNSSPWWKFWE